MINIMKRMLKNEQPREFLSNSFQDNLRYEEAVHLNLYDDLKCNLFIFEIKMFRL